VQVGLTGTAAFQPGDRPLIRFYRSAATPADEWFLHDACSLALADESGTEV